LVAVGPFIGPRRYSDCGFGNPLNRCQFMGRIKVGIPDAHLDRLMAGQLLNFLERGSGHRQPGTKRMAIGMPDVPFDVRLFESGIEPPTLHTLGDHREDYTDTYAEVVDLGPFDAAWIMDHEHHHYFWLRNRKRTYAADWPEFRYWY
jgi:hypothetical protein